MSDNEITHAFGWQLDKGRIRDKNEDSLGAAKIKLVSEDTRRSVGLYMIADGIGGMPEGEKASRVAIQTAMQEMMSHINQAESAEDIMAWLQQAAQMAHLTIQLQKEDEDSQGTTLVMASVIEDHIYVANIGDSRAYIIQDGRMRQITKDHTVAQSLADQGAIEQADVDKSPFIHVLSQAVGLDKIESDVYQENTKVGDYLLLCSDGLHGFVDAKKILAIIKKAKTPQIASDNLANAANEAGGKDNIAVIVVEIKNRES
ncbi:MAG: hypothetical protein Phog2KO_41910 [Phototrophicaceae bacterium]